MSALSRSSLSSTEEPFDAEHLSTEYRWTMLGVAGLTLSIFIPFSLYYSVKIWRHRHSIIIHKRFPYLILVTVIANCIYLSTEKTFFLLLSLKCIPFVDYTNNAQMETVEFAVYAAIHWIFIYAIYLTVLRYWLLYFKLEC